MAAWDAYAKALSVPLACALGGAVKPMRAYNSCGLWIKDPALLADEAAELLSEGGYSALKLRIGRPEFQAGSGRGAQREEAHRRRHHR